MKRQDAATLRRLLGGGLLLGPESFANCDMVDMEGMYFGLCSPPRLGYVYSAYGP